MTQLSHASPEFDRFLFAPLDDNGETPLTILSALARQDIDAWQEAARLAQLPKDHAVNSLASTIWKSDSERWSPLTASVAAARLVELLPSHSATRERSIPTDNDSGKIVMWLTYGIIFWSIAISGSITQQANRNAGVPNHVNATAEQQAVASQPLRGANSD
jgi:hypothetical protein